MQQAETGTKYERKPIDNPTALINLAKEINSQHKQIVLITDFDNTISQEGPDGGTNPFTTRVNPFAGQSLATLGRQGVAIGACTARTGEEIYKKLAEFGIENPLISSVSGMEIYGPDSNQEGKMVSRIDLRYLAHSEAIRKTLAQIDRVFRKGVDPMEPYPMMHPKIEETIISSKGPIYIQTKGIGPQFPQGLARLYNLNALPHPERQKISSALGKEFEGIKPTLDPELQKIWGETTVEEPGDRYSWGIAPTITQAKGYGVLNVLRNITDSPPYNKNPLGLVIFSGDSDPDGEAMHALRLTESVSHGAVKTAGIWVKPDTDQPRAREQSDIKFDSVEEYAQFLASLSKQISPIE